MTGSRTAVAFSVLVLAGCRSLIEAPTPTNMATAELVNTSGKVVALASLTEVSEGVRIVVDARGLPPGTKGVHIHEVGKCEPPAFASAGAHFNPLGKKHGLLSDGGPHAGDLPNIVIGPDGTGRLETLNNRVSLNGSRPSLVDGDGSAIVIHADPDDFKTDPDGTTGARIACGVITKKR